MAKKKKQPPFKKRFFKSSTLHGTFAFIISLGLRFIHTTSRVTHDYAPAALPYLHGEKPAIFCFWHGRLAMQAFVKPPRTMIVLMSNHNDGAMAGSVMRWFDIDKTVSDKKNGAAVRTMLGIAKRGDNICITPDGPRGPSQIAADGATFVAMMTGYPIIPITFSASHHWRLKSWDRFLLPKPFSTIRFIASDPIIVPRAKKGEADTTTASNRILTDALNQITHEADRRCGWRDPHTLQHHQHPAHALHRHLVAETRRAR